jgi:hypothetical protein
LEYSSKLKGVIKMKKAIALVAMMAMGTMLTGCYSTSCGEPQPAPSISYKDGGYAGDPVMVPGPIDEPRSEVMVREEREPQHWQHKRHHHKKPVHHAHKKAEHHQAEHMKKAAHDEPAANQGAAPQEAPHDTQGNMQGQPPEQQPQH